MHTPFTPDEIEQLKELHSRNRAVACAAAIYSRHGTWREDSVKAAVARLANDSPMPDDCRQAWLNFGAEFPDIVYKHGHDSSAVQKACREKAPVWYDMPSVDPTHIFDLKGVEDFIETWNAFRRVV